VIFGLAQSVLPGLSGAAPRVVEPATFLSVFEGYIGVLIAAFLVTVLTTPIARRMAIANGVVDRPNARKIHRTPIAYLGGVAVYLGILAGVMFSFLAVKFPGLINFHATEFLHDDGYHFPVPLSILLGLTVILFVGVLDDVTGISPRVKIGGQLFAAAALAVDNVGVKLAAGIMVPLAKAAGIATTVFDGSETILFRIPLPVPIGGATDIPLDLVYWAGTALIAIAVLGLCNASNLIDGLDGLLTGTTAIAATGLLVLALGLALADDGPRDAQRIVLCLALLGACLGFLPHNFNPANIFLGDAGSLMLGFCTCAIILTLGDTGKTFLVVAGLIIFALPIIDTTLAIARRKLEGKEISAADDQHLHHMLKRALGVKGAVLTLYGIAAVFAVLGAAITHTRARVIYVLAMLLASYIGITAIKIARRKAGEPSVSVGISPGVPPADRSASAPAREVPQPPAAPGPIGPAPAYHGGTNH